MERLTKRTSIGDYCPGKGTNEHQRIQRLAAYEDILFAPDGTQRITLDKLSELVTAEQNGRLVELPCKVGDTIFVIAHCADVVMDYDNNYETGTGAQECPFEYDCDYEECDDDNRRIFETICSGFWCESSGEWEMFADKINADVGISDFGKTVFLTRAEAEAAMKEKL